MRNKKKYLEIYKKLWSAAKLALRKRFYSNKCWTKEIWKSQKINFVTPEIRIRKTTKAQN